MEQGSRRVISTASSYHPRSKLQKGSLAEYLAASRQPSRHESLTSTPSTSRLHRDNDGRRDSAASDVAHVDEDASALRFADEISPSTAAWVQKAKTYFELAHEHRRLLPHLPPIRRPGSHVRTPGPEASMKVYNPLQYVRNRKLRIWEKNAIDAEADGWHDVEKVRAWVDAVIASHSSTCHEPDECLRLPPLSQPVSEVEEDDQEASPMDDRRHGSPTPRSAEQHHTKPLRPRSDWVTHPGDLIADAYWLEQGSNKLKIQDRDNNLIYPPDTHFRFSGWRNPAPIEVPPMPQEPTPPPDSWREQDHEAPSSTLPELPTFTSAHHSHTGRDRRRRREKLKDSLAVKDHGGLRRRRKLFQDGSSISESSASIFSSSSSDEAERGRKHFTHQRQKSELVQEVSSLAAHLTGAHTKESIHPHNASLGDSSQPSSAQASKRSSVDLSRLGRLLGRDSAKPSTPMSQSQTRHESVARPTAAIPVRSSLEDERLPRSSTDYDTTAPNSPAEIRWPSIAINLSPPTSRSPSPTKRPLPSILHPLRERKQSKQSGLANAPDSTDLATTELSSHPSGDGEHIAGSSSTGSRGTSPMTRGISPMARGASVMATGLSPLTESRTQSSQNDSPQDQRGSTVSRISSKSTGPANSDHSRIRGIFKGGRIAEIVGNEVSRVGDFIWKRDPPSAYRHRLSHSDASLRSYHDSESDQDINQNGHVYKTPPPQIARSRSSTLSSTRSEPLSPVASKTSPESGTRPHYYNPNLPSFTSPFQRDREQQEKKKEDFLTPSTSPQPGDDGDHVSRLAAQHRSASHSPRLGQLAPPRLDTGRALTPDGLSRRTSYGFPVLNLSRSREASDKFNHAISDDLKPPVAGLAALKPSRSAGDLSQSIDASSAELEEESVASAIVSRREMWRAEALLYSSAVKAREIGRRADNPRGLTPKFLLDTLTLENGALHSPAPLCITRRQEHVVAARNVMAALAAQASTFNEKLDFFTKSVAPTLHTQLQTLEDMVENKMTPQVRVTADEAGELSTKLTTTSTLAVKGLNDSITRAFRRRRRGPIRWVRRLWFGLIEWGVVGLLWAIWAIVTSIRVVLGCVRGVVKMGKWLLWLD